MKIAIDAMGGDFAPKAIVEGAVNAANELPENVKIVLIGKQGAILEVLRKLDYKASSIEIINADDVIEMGEHPTKALAQKPNSSIGVGFRLLKEGEIQAFCSAGNTGAMMVGSLFSIKTMEGIQRPAIAGFFPLKNGGHCLMLDIGANADCKPEILEQFAELGSLYAQFSMGIENPKVALLSIGEEEEKGSVAVQATHQRLKINKKINFIGNVEGRDIVLGKADVIVTDGFTGNVIFKMGESFYDYAAETGLKDQLIDRMNYEAVGGSPIIGVNGNVIIGHGISSALAIKNMIFLAQKQVEANTATKMAQALKR